MRVAVFLRGINVGGNKKIAMAELKRALEERGYNDPKTLLQSGNVVVDKAKAADIEKLIKDVFGLDVRVMTRTHAELKAVVANNPFTQHASEGSKLNVAFLDAPLSKLDLDPTVYAPDEFVLNGKEIYLWYPNGMGRSKLLADAPARKIGAVATVRNWNTVQKMLDLTS
ncbi:DUF1697 domain-containing protein [Catelliglobosispora koreensis]|uniref:DUF1697 domain-containing protein n=1 Tax=Catelliglobosispora koreensis TaxID=129052 RepID=UPI00036A07C1|nr:DUF1697 domain-containing protein [Catelliglobosispora koreensis]